MAFRAKNSVKFLYTKNVNIPGRDRDTALRFNRLEDLRETVRKSYIMLYDSILEAPEFCLRQKKMA